MRLIALPLATGILSLYVCVCVFVSKRYERAGTHVYSRSRSRPQVTWSAPKKLSTIIYQPCDTLFRLSGIADALLLHVRSLARATFRADRVFRCVVDQRMKEPRASRSLVYPHRKSSRDVRDSRRVRWCAISEVVGCASKSACARPSSRVSFASCSSTFDERGRRAYKTHQ